MKGPLRKGVEKWKFVWKKKYFIKWKGDKYSVVYTFYFYFFIYYVVVTI